MGTVRGSEKTDDVLFEPEFISQYPKLETFVVRHEHKQWIVEPKPQGWQDEPEDIPSAKVAAATADADKLSALSVSENLAESRCMPVRLTL